MFPPAPSSTDGLLYHTIPNYMRRRQRGAPALTALETAARMVVVVAASETQRQRRSFAVVAGAPLVARYAVQLRRRWWGASAPLSPSSTPFLVASSPGHQSWWQHGWRPRRARPEAWAALPPVRAGGRAARTFVRLLGNLHHPPKRTFATTPTLGPATAATTVGRGCVDGAPVAAEAGVAAASRAAVLSYPPLPQRPPIDLASRRTSPGLPGFPRCGHVPVVSPSRRGRGFPPMASKSWRRLSYPSMAWVLAIFYVFARMWRPLPEPFASVVSVPSPTIHHRCCTLSAMTLLKSGDSRNLRNERRICSVSIQRTTKRRERQQC